MEPNLQNEPIQPTVTPVQSFEPKKSLPKWPLVIVGLILMLILVGGAYFLGQKSALTTQAPKTASNSQISHQAASTPALNSTPTLTPTPTLNPTANWKTYSDSNDFYSFKYPETWFLNGDNSTNVHNSVGISPIKLQGVDQAYSNMIAFNVADNPSNLTIEDYAKANISPQPTNYSIVTVAGIEGKKTTDLPGQFNNDEIFLKYKNKIYTITLIKSPGQQILPSTFDQILSTFKFTQ